MRLTSREFPVTLVRTTVLPPGQAYNVTGSKRTQPGKERHVIGYGQRVSNFYKSTDCSAVALVGASLAPANGLAVALSPHGLRSRPSEQLPDRRPRQIGRAQPRLIRERVKPRPPLWR